MIIKLKPKKLDMKKKGEEGFYGRQKGKLK